MIRTFLFLLLFISSLIPSGLSACSNIAINGNGFHIVSRTMDFPFNSGNTFGVGFKGEKNVSNTVLSHVPKGKEAHWKNKQTYIGQTWLNGPVIVDGMNDAGVSAAFLYLPNISQYPQYNPQDKRPALTFYDSLNYVLSQAHSVKDALQKLRKMQIVDGGLAFKYKGKTGYLMKLPGHLSIRDKTGDAAVIESVNGHLYIYPHAGPVLTNSPAYSWQIKNANRYDYVQSKHNINAQFDGQYMNGSGFIGLPGDWTPPNRFARATQIIKNMPSPENHNQAIRLALDVIESVQVPVGASDSPTFWKTVSDLNNRVYYYYPMFTMTKEYTVMGTKGTEALSPDISHAWQKYDLRTLAKTRKRPKGAIPALITKTPKNNIKKVVDWLTIKTAGPTKTDNKRYQQQVQEALMVTGN